MSTISCFIAARSSAGRPRQAAATLKKVYFTNWRGWVLDGLVTIVPRASWHRSYRRARTAPWAGSGSECRAGGAAGHGRRDRAEEEGSAPPCVIVPRSG